MASRSRYRKGGTQLHLNAHRMKRKGQNLKAWRERQALLKANANADEASTSFMPSEFSAAPNYDMMEKNGGTNISSDQMNKDPNRLYFTNEETITPDLEARCCNNAPTSYLDTTGIVIKQEIIETEVDPILFDDTPFYSPIASGPSETEFDAQRPSTSYSESAKSNTDTCGRSQALRSVKVESDVSSTICDESSKKHCTFSARNGRLQSRVPHPVLNTPESRTKEQPRASSHTGSPSLTLNSTRDGRSCVNAPSPPQVTSHSNLPLRSRDRFDIFGEFIASKLRNLDSKSSSFIGSALVDLLFKADMGMFKKKDEREMILGAQTDDVGKAMPPSTESVRGHGSSGKENNHSRLSSNVENAHLHQDIGFSRDGAVQLNSPISPLASIAGTDKSSRNEPTQPRDAPHIAPVINVTVPESSSRNSPNLTRASSLSGTPVLNTANSSRNGPIQTSVPSHMRHGDGFDVYVEYMTLKLRNLDLKSRAVVQTAIAELMFKAELGRFVGEDERCLFTDSTDGFTSEFAFW